MMQLKAALGDAQEEIGRVIVESNGFKGVIEKVTKAVEDLIESGTIDLWAQNVRAAIASLIPVMEKMGGGWTWIKDKVAGAAAFWGAVAGGAGMDEAIKAMDIIPKKVEAEKQARLQAIREEKKAKADATEEAEKAEMAVATVKREADEKEQKRIEKIAELKKKKTDLEKKAAQLERDANRKKWEEEKKNAEAALERTKEIAEKTISGYIKERRAAKAEKEDDEAQFRNAAKLESKVKRGIRLSKRDREILDTAREIARERRKVGGLKGKVSEAQKQIDALGEQTKSLHDIRKLLEDNLKEQQALSKAG
jgi:chromosome segregation ATPase